MDLSEEVRATNKRAFLKFFDQSELSIELKKDINTMINRQERRLIIKLSHLYNHREGADLARRLLQNPSEYMQPLCDAMTEMVRSCDAKYLKEGEQVLVGLDGPFVSRRVTPRDLLSGFIGSIVCVEGIVTKCSLVRPKVVKSVHFCPETGKFTTREYRDITSNMGLPTGSVYPTRDDQGKLLVTEYGLCTYKDHQTLSMQEVPENSAPGQLPRTVDVILEDDLVDKCKPGDRVAIVGIYKALAGKSKGNVNGVFRTVLIANSVFPLNKSTTATQFGNKDRDNILKISKRDDVFDFLANSLAPSIYGHTWIKKSLVLLMLGGSEKNLKNGTHLRGTLSNVFPYYHPEKLFTAQVVELQLVLSPQSGLMLFDSDINMMMVGDPSVAKSQLLRAIMNIAPLAISTTGRGSSGVGLTAAVTSDQETGERRLEAGAMVLADRGVVCIDEFDKMNDQDRVAIHEVMEQQTVTIAKAGIHASLNARCSVVAAANPIYGTYDRSLTPTKNIGLPDSLLSRFDLLFIVLDQMDPGIDRHISEHVLRMHRFRSTMDGDADVGTQYEREDEGDANSTVFVKYNRMLHGRKTSRKRETLTIDFLKKYIHYAKHRIQPELTDEASDQIATAYAELRSASSNAKTRAGTLPITARTLETIIRLSTAHAKLKLRRQVLKADVDAALQVLNFAIYHQELTEMEEREQERERENERKRRSENNAGDTGRPRHQGARNDRENGDASGRTGEAMEVDGSAGTDVNISPERLEAFSAALGRYRHAQHVEQISVADIEGVVNSRASVPFSNAEIMTLLEMMEVENKLFFNRDANVVYFV